MRGGDVEEHELVGAFLVVDGRKLDRITRIAQVHEVDTFDHAPLVNVETRDDTLGEHRTATPSVPLRPQSPAGG